MSSAVDICCSALIKLGATAIASFDDAHYEQVLQALKPGKHLFVEKPLCRTIEEAAAIKKAWELAGRPALESNLVLRAAPMYRWLKSAIEAGEFGEIYAIDGDYLYGRLNKITQGWRGEIPDYSVTLGGGIHMIDLMLWLSDQRPDRVSVVGNRISTRGSSFRYDDFAAATFTFPSGLVGRIATNYGCVHRHHHVLRVFGTKATFIYDDVGARLHRSRSPEERAAPILAPPLPTAKGDLIPGVVQAILNRENTSPSAQRNFDLICACAAAEASLREGYVRTVDYLE